MSKYIERLQEIEKKYFNDKEALHSEIDEFLIEIIVNEIDYELAKKIVLLLDGCWYS